ncbi:HTTM domain-containing protein [Salinimicrobium soli]|uniref:HTTM domain-containing protein n=1 Tax=Salinimicrobium soli TaxID=1254399 RepID=UPI003AAED6CB
MLNKWLFKQIDNSALVVFRIIFGALLAIEAFGAIFSGWIKRVLLEPNFTFNFIGFEFLQPLPGNGMLWYYAVMGLAGVFVMIGFKYRISISVYTVMWASVYLMQKSSYNNHYYLLMLLCFLMILLPAHRYASVDARMNPEIKKTHMPQWVWLLLVLQMWIVYTYAAIAKLYPDWWDATLPGLLMRARHHYWLVGDFLQQQWVHYSIAYFGFFFDLLIIPLLLWKRTRIFAFLAAVFFHLFNSFIFHIGIFPYLALAFTLFFFPSEKINRLFLWKKPYYSEGEIIVPRHRILLISFLGIWFVVQIALPVRHWFFQDDVLWTEEGHRLSWRMMLRSKGGVIQFKVVDKEKRRDTIFVNLEDYLSTKQLRSLPAKPDLIWQFAQRLEKEYAEKGKKIEVYVDSKVSINGRPYQPYIDPSVDLAAEKWRHFSHSPWILPSSME